MLYTNEEPLVQRTCIKTASLQSEEISSKGTSSKEVLSKRPSSNELESETIPPKEPEYKVEITDSHLWSSGLNIFIG